MEKNFSEEKIEAIVTEMRSLAKHGDGEHPDTKIDVKKMD
jgi:hypothetical protein